MRLRRSWRGAPLINMTARIFRWEVTSGPGEGQAAQAEQQEAYGGPGGSGGRKNRREQQMQLALNSKYYAFYKAKLL